MTTTAMTPEAQLADLRARWWSMLDGLARGAPATAANPSERNGRRLAKLLADICQLEHAISYVETTGELLWCRECSPEPPAIRHRAWWWCQVHGMAFKAKEHYDGWYRSLFGMEREMAIAAVEEEVA
jgi:hypothetical protein